MNTRYLGERKGGGGGEEVFFRCHHSFPVLFCDVSMPSIFVTIETFGYVEMLDTL